MHFPETLNGKATSGLFCLLVAHHNYKTRANGPKCSYQGEDLKTLTGDIKNSSFSDKGFCRLRPN